MRARILATLTVLVAALGLGLGVPAASAHDVLVSTSPKDGSTVATAPTQVRLTFNNPAIATGSAVQVTGPTGRVDEGRPVFTDSDVTQALRPGAPAGSYTVRWRVTSVDGHPISGSFRFTATAAAAGTSSSSSSAPSTGSTTSPGASAGSASATPGAGPATPGAGSAAPGAGSADSQDSGGTGAWPLVVAAVVLAALVTAAVAVSRRRRPAGHDEDD
ncbi:copper resistance protein CopC [Luteipulveratus sp. YIM 133132]|uniref:copper resistance CopC family protein n=1 Tax=Luteipulveratus flavus TaxID=3031728 RepID=UPI0023B0006F|nr:copper resistance CopC family protein [Luteipulveratus sp. YIM 133132]MDE9366725.1 copper resistance protein CopC [Luteipulveratus sp. YIM 133132]